VKGKMRNNGLDTINFGPGAPLFQAAWFGINADKNVGAPGWKNY
jgi:hypothetical protein